MSTKTTIVRQGSSKRSITVSLPNGLTAADLVAALNSKEVKEVGNFLICADTFSARVEDSTFDFSDASWEVVSAGVKTDEFDPVQAAEEMKSNARKDAEQAAREASERSFLHQIESLNRSAYELHTKGDMRGARKIVFAAIVLYRLAGGGDSDEAHWLFSIKSFICTASGQHQAAWRYGVKALQIRRRLHGKSSAKYGISLNNFAEGQIAAGCYERAEKMLIEGIGLIDKAVANKNVGLKWAANARADAMQNYHRLLQLTGRSKEAEAGIKNFVQTHSQHLLFFELNHNEL
jgi:tetratricopeptide (TPR) repeat protein